MRSRSIPFNSLTETDRALWTRWCDETPHLGSPFFSYQFATIVNKHRGDVFVCRIYSGDRIVGYLPFHFRPVVGGFLKSATKLGAHLSDYCGVVAAPEWRSQPEALLKSAGIASFKFDHLIEDQAQNGLTAQPYGTGTRISFGRNVTEYLARAVAARPVFFKQLAGQERALQRDIGPIRISYNRQNAADELREIISKKRDQYRRSNSPDALGAGWTQGVLFDLLQSHDPQCAGVLSTLYAGDTWAAAHFGIRFRGTLHWWFPVFNRQLRKYSPGSILLRHAIELSPAHGVETIDFGRGDSQYKRIYPYTEYTVYGGYWYLPGVSSFLDRALWSIGWRLENALHYIEGRMQPHKPKPDADSGSPH